MICPVCGVRYAPMPIDKFIYEDNVGFMPIDEKAEAERMKVFDSDEKCACKQCSF